MLIVRFILVGWNYQCFLFLRHCDHHDVLWLAHCKAVDLLWLQDHLPQEVPKSSETWGKLNKITENARQKITVVAVDINHWRLPMTKITGNCRWQRGSAQSHSNLATNLRTCHHQMVNGPPPPGGGRPSSGEIIKGRDFGKGCSVPWMCVSIWEAFEWYFLFGVCSGVGFFKSDI